MATYAHGVRLRHRVEFGVHVGDVHDAGESGRGPPSSAKRRAVAGARPDVFPVDTRAANEASKDRGEYHHRNPCGTPGSPMSHHG